MKKILSTVEEQEFDKIKNTNVQFPINAKLPLINIEMGVYQIMPPNPMNHVTIYLSIVKNSIRLQPTIKTIAKVNLKRKMKNWPWKVMGLNLRCLLLKMKWGASNNVPQTYKSWHNNTRKEIESVKHFIKFKPEERMKTSFLSD